MSNIKKILCLFLIVIFLIPSNTFVSIAEKKENVNTKELIAEVEKYVSSEYVKINGEYIKAVRFDMEKAVSNGANDRVKEVGDVINEYYNTTVDSVYSNNYESRSIIPAVYGNYCGPGVSGNDFNDEPIDGLDRACMRHDKCYARYGYFNCSCDEELVAYVKDNIDSYSGYKHTVAAGMLVIFGNNKCK